VRGLLRRIVLGIAAGVLVYVGFSIWADTARVAEAMRSFAWAGAAAALALAAANYFVRFLRWQLYLRVLGVAVPPLDSGLVFLAGFSLTVTPGKLGEVLKAFLLRELRGVPVARTAPIVVAERFTDLVGLLVLAGAGAFTFPVDRGFLVAGVVLVAAGLAAVSVKPVAAALLALAGRIPGLGRMAPRLDAFYRSTADLLRPGPLLAGTALSVVSWAFECVAFWVVVHSFAGASIGLEAATFIYAAMTIAGALSFLPGGLGVTEAGMLGLLVQFGSGADRGVAAAATFVTRLCTLWFAVVLGVIALVALARRTGAALAVDGGAAPVPAGAARPGRWAALAIAAMAAAFTAAVLGTDDPVRRPGVLRPQDTRKYRLGAMTHAEAEALLAARRRERDAEPDGTHRAVRSAQISDLLVRRHMYDEALREIEAAMRIVPGRPELVARRAMVLHALGRKGEARRELDAAEALAPDHPNVAGARRVLDDRGP